MPPAGTDLHDAARRAPVRPRRGDEPLDDRDLAVLTGVDHQAGEHGDTVAGDPVLDDDRLGEHPAGGHTHDRRAHERPVELGKHVGRFAGEQFGFVVDAEPSAPTGNSTSVEHTPG